MVEKRVDDDSLKESLANEDPTTIVIVPDTKEDHFDQLYDDEEVEGRKFLNFLKSSDNIVYRAWESEDYWSESPIGFL